MNSIVKRCPADGYEHELQICACSICFGTLRFWCGQCQMWLSRAGCALCGEHYGTSLPFEGDQVNEWIVTSVHDIRNIICEHFADVSAGAILGPHLYSLMGRSSGHDLTALALSADCMRAAIDAVNADGTIAYDEIRRIHPFMNAVATFYAKYRSNYRPFVNFELKRTPEFVRFFETDTGSFGYSDELTLWSGLRSCANLASLCRDTRALDLYERLIMELASKLVALGGTTSSERRMLDALNERIIVARNGM